jgi:cell wall-associated NlpC family hydrolase
LRLTNGIMALGLATIIAVAGIGAGATPATATDPTPAPSADPSPSASPDPSPSADPSATPDPSASPSSDPSASPDPAPTDPVVDPASGGDTAGSTVVALAPVVKRVDKGRLVSRIALRQRHDRYVRGATGPNAFDCSGLVRYAYRKAGVSRKLGGGHSARTMLAWGRRHGLTSRRNPQVGDVVIYGNGRHAAIYIGRGRVISALNPRLGIRITRLHALTDPFTTFIHTRI